MINSKLLLSIAEIYNDLVSVANNSIIETIQSNVRVGNLFYIPDTIRILIKEHGKSIEHWKKELIKLEKEGLIGLQPESGMNRLKEEDKEYVIHLNVGGQVYDLTWGTIKNKKIAAIEIPVIENGSPEAKNFYSFTRGVHSKLSGAQTAARKYMKGGEDEVVILHTPEGRMNQEYWAVGYLKINKEASKIHRNNKNGYIDLVSGGWGVEIHSKTKPESGDKVFIDLSYLNDPPTDQTFAEEIVDKVLSESRDLKNSIKYICSIQSQDQVKSIMGIK
jgi:hypothetical protein